MEFNYPIKMPKDSLTLQTLMDLFVVTYTEKGRMKKDFIVSSIQSGCGPFRG